MGSAASAATLMLHSISAAQSANATFFFTLRPPPSSANGPILFRLLALWGVDAALGWEAEKTDRALTLRLPAVSQGEYQRICSLLEKTVYGGIVLEPFEERALDRFLYHLTGQDMKKSLGMWLKLHYACLKKRK